LRVEAIEQWRPLPRRQQFAGALSVAYGRYSRAAATTETVAPLPSSGATFRGAPSHTHP
jgi:hypothetical protein